MHSNSDTQRLWLSRASFGLAAAALLSMIHTGCQENAETKLHETPEQTLVPPNQGAQNNTGAQGANGTEAAGEQKIAETPKVTEAIARTELVVKDDKKGGEADAPKSGIVADSIEVKRLVVANDVENREPVAEPTFVAGQSDVLAFVELANDADVDQKIVITFEQGEKKVGLVELNVPAKQSRWRTWGKTKNIKTAGEWSAVVSTEDGVELKRVPFAVDGADVPTG